MPLVTVTKPTEYAVSLDDAKEQCRVTDTAHDSLILRLLKEATASIETETGARLASQTVRLVLDKFPSGTLDLCVYPVSAVTEVAYDDADNVEQTLTLNTDYWEMLDGMYPKLEPVTAWPSTKSGKPGAVRITMTVGYSDLDDIADDLKHAILIRTKEYFDNSGESDKGMEIYPTLTTVRQLIANHRRQTL